MKKLISMCFIGDYQNQLVLKREDWRTWTRSLSPSTSWKLSGSNP